MKKVILLLVIMLSITKTTMITNDMIMDIEDERQLTEKSEYVIIKEILNNNDIYSDYLNNSFL